MAGDQDDAPSSVDGEDNITPKEEWDIGGKEYVRSKLAARRRMAEASFVLACALVTVVTLVGLFKPGAAERIDHMGTFLSVALGALFSFVAAYMGLGTYELRNSMVGEGSRFTGTDRWGVQRRYGDGGSLGSNRSPHRIARTAEASAGAASEAGLGLDAEDAGNDGRGG